MARTMSRGGLLCLMLITLAGGARAQAAQGGEREFVGTINNTLKIRMKLTRKPNEWLGSYAYERVGKAIRLAGAVSGDDTFYLNEFDENGTATAKFDGRFVTDDWIEGTWAPATAGKKELSFSAWAVDGRAIPADDPSDKLSGSYRRVYRGRFDKDAASLDVWRLKDGRYRVSGDAIWVGNVATGNVNVGSTEGVYNLSGNRLLVKSGDEDGCNFTITFGAGALTVADDTGNCGGVHVTFDGTYRKTSPPKR
jgi:hypothetical protein